ncbi:ribosome-associated translation inhibitor RaiA [Cohnella pontilimi]|uniref:Ribosome-associated translation inhibitor RaiA n=1 Tax=Cohnella pontilimi TaxID=2564100 RepID=A0A4V5LRZ0_9BACL|nr:ribosome-associated translation inhibitor RaiA [Cohnella pontilimi]TJY41129.1 ribosome-associated translation inhibitor RaiA [Cohnella pontilimi]
MSSLKMIIRGKNVEVTEALKEYAELKLGRLNKAPVEEAEIHVILSLLGHQPLHKVEVTLLDGGTVIRAEEVTEDMYTSIDQAAVKLNSKFRRWREKLRTRLKRAEFNDSVQDYQEEEAPEEYFQVERIKGVPIKRKSYTGAITVRTA